MTRNCQGHVRVIIDNFNAIRQYSGDIGLWLGVGACVCVCMLVCVINVLLTKHLKIHQFSWQPLSKSHKYSEFIHEPINKFTVRVILSCMTFDTCLHIQSSQMQNDRVKWHGCRWRRLETKASRCCDVIEKTMNK